MAILPTDIKLLKSERMRDTSDGGGRRTSIVILDNTPGEIFEKVARQHSVYGKFYLRKIYGHVDTANVDEYAGAHVVLLDGPNTDRIQVVIFAAASDYETRTGARDRIERYVVAGPESRMVMYGRQLVGQRAVVLYQAVGDPLPDVGQVLCLSNEPLGVTGTQQYVRIDDVTHEVRVFTDERGDFERRIVTLKTTTVLRYEFPGVEAVSRYSNPTRSAVARNTTVVDAARYYGVADVAEAAEEGTLMLRLVSIFANLVPTTQREAPIANAELSAATAFQAVASEPLAWFEAGAAGFGNFQTYPISNTINFGHPIVPGSFQVRMGNYGGAPPGAVATDDGQGVIPASGWNGRTGYINAGTINYETGVVVVSGVWTEAMSIVSNMRYMHFSYMPAAQVSQPVHTRDVDITISTRGTVYVESLSPRPARRTAYLDYRAQNKWYRLRDLDGTGALVGDDIAYGTGSVDYVTGNVVVTLGALPDVGSRLLFGWASPAHYTPYTGATDDTDGIVRLRAMLGADLPVKPGSVTVSFKGGVANATTYTSTADSNGVITAVGASGCTGTVDHATGQLDLAFSSRLPNMATNITVTYNKETPTGAATSVTGTQALTTGAMSFTAVANIATQGLRIFAPVLVQAVVNGPTEVIQIPCADNGSGQIVSTRLEFKTLDRNWRHVGGQTVGTVNYTTGLVTVAPSAYVDIARLEYTPTLWSSGLVIESGGWQPVSRPALLQDGDYAWTARTTATSTDTPVTVNIDPLTSAALTLDLTDTSTGGLVPGSVLFTAFGKQYFDRAGEVFYDYFATAGVGTLAGEVDYDSGKVSFTKWVNDTAPGVSVQGCLTQSGTFTAVDAKFRLAGAPVRPASTYVQVVAADGDTLTATAGADGEISGAFARGVVIQELGIVSIQWGEMVTAAGNEDEPWYDPDLVVGGEIWRPREVLPSTIRYNAVVLTNLPLDADLLGLDPTRLPIDGRVPIFRPGDMVLIHNSKETELDDADASDTQTVGRTDLAALVLVDAEGSAVPADQYEVNLAAGSVTFAADLDLGDLVEPLTARHRIEELNLVSDAQINGEIALTSPLTRDFDEDTRVSSCLMLGDIAARVTNVFDQNTWTGEWSDTRIGSNTAGEYDTINYPIEVTNAGAVTDRWRISFVSTTDYQVISENLGVIATGNTSADCAPTNPLTSRIYFRIRSGGWGAGWPTGGQLRFNTISAAPGFWLARTALPGAPRGGDSIDVQLRGDIDE